MPVKRVATGGASGIGHHLACGFVNGGNLLVDGGMIKKMIYEETVEFNK